MSATTPFLNLYKPGGGSTGLIVPDEVVDVDRFNTNFDSIDAWAQTTDTFRLAQLTRGQQYRGLTANIGSVTSPVKGDTYQETDLLLRKWEYDGSNWVTGDNGMYLIYPTSVVGATVVGGEIVPPNGVNGSTNPILVNGVFSDTFKNYLIKYRLTLDGGNTAVSLRLRASGTEYAAADYTYQCSSTSGAAISASRLSAQSNVAFSSTASNHYSGNIELWNPRISGQPKIISIDNMAVGPDIFRAWGFLGNSGGDAYIADGFSITLGSAVTWNSTTGTSWVKVYGMN